VAVGLQGCRAVGQVGEESNFGAPRADLAVRCPAPPGVAHTHGRAPRPTQALDSNNPPRVLR
jgi:hypothetical protein